MRNIDNSTFLTLIASFCLSAIAYTAAQPEDIPVQEIEFDEYIIEPNIEYIEFDDYVITAQSDESDDGDTKGIDWDQRDAFWCATHPDECDNDEEEPEEGGYECAV